MNWNWQQKDWPNFRYQANEFSHYERDFQHNAGVMAGSIKHITADDQELLRVSLVSDEALKTSEIEGELLNRDSLQSSVRRQFGLKTDERRISPAEQGISEMLVDLYQHYQSPMTHEQLFAWHRMLTNRRRDLRAIGTYRNHGEPMQIVSGKIYDPTLHYEAPPSSRVFNEMERFITWFNETGASQRVRPTTLLRAGIAHLYFESIHPFEDGNGRIGRAISEKALSQSLGRPTLIAIATVIEKKRKNYYAALQAGSRSLEIDKWLHYFCQMVLLAQEYTQQKIDFLINKGKFYQCFANRLNKRQAKVIEHVFREGVERFTGGLSAENYISLTSTSRATTTRDLQDLVAMGALIKTGERKQTRYYLGEH